MSAPAVRLSSSSVPNVYSKWFGRVVWLGVLVNFSFALPALFMPGRVLALLNVEPAFPHIWVRFSGLLLGLLSLFYLPAAGNLYHYRANAWLAVLSRAAVVAFIAVGVFYYGASNAYLPFGLVDLVFGAAQAVLLILALREEKWA